MLRNIVMVLVIGLGTLPFVTVAQDFCDSNLPIVTYMRLYETCTTGDSTVALDNTETIELFEFGGEVTISYPDTWVLQVNSDGILIANSNEALTINDPTSVDDIPSGSVIIQITVFPTEILSAVITDREITPVAVIETLSTFMADDELPGFTDVTELSINQNAAASTTGSNETLSATMYAVDNGNSYTFGFSATRVDEAAQHKAVIEAIIGSAQFTTTE